MDRRNPKVRKDRHLSPWPEIDRQMKNASPANQVRYLYLKSLLRDVYDDYED